MIHLHVKPWRNYLDHHEECHVKILLFIKVLKMFLNNITGSGHRNFGIPYTSSGTMVAHSVAEYLFCNIYLCGQYDKTISKVDLSNDFGFCSCGRGYQLCLVESHISF